MINKESKIYVAGHQGLVGSALMRHLRVRFFRNVVTRSRREMDLFQRDLVMEFFEQEKPDVVIMAAAKVGGIIANKFHGECFLMENLKIQNNIFEAALANKTPNLVFLGSSCVYPVCGHPISEHHLFSSRLEETNRPYALAKIAGMEYVNCIRKNHNLNWFSVMPTNLYGENDDFSPVNGHVLPALITRFLSAKKHNLDTIYLYGDGSQAREFMHSDDCADAIIHLLTQDKINFPASSMNMFHINIGSGEEVSIRQLANMIAREIEYKGNIDFVGELGGVQRKFMNSSVIYSTGWKPQIKLETGIKRVINHLVSNGFLESL